MPKKYLSVVLMALSCLMASAQNSIDRMVEQYSTLGGSSFVTAVKRNPKTHKVEKVVKRLTASGLRTQHFIDTFKEEARRQKDVVTTTADGYTTMIVTVEGAKQNRIYTLRYPSKERPYPDVTVTIIINMKR